MNSMCSESYLIVTSIIEFCCATPLFNCNANDMCKSAIRYTRDMYWRLRKAKLNFNETECYDSLFLNSAFVHVRQVSHHKFKTLFDLNNIIDLMTTLKV